MADYLSLLPPLLWRGLNYPVSARSVSFTHDGVRHKFQYRDGEMVEQTGAQALTFSYTIPMRDGIARGPYRDLVTKGLPLLFADCQNRARGPLQDPFYGTFDCVPTSYRDDTDVNKRDGTDIQVEFVRTLETGEADTLPDFPTVSGLISEAGALDKELSKTSFKQEASADGSNDILTQLTGIGAQIQQQGQGVSARLQGLADKMKRLDEQIDSTEDPSKWGLQQSARNVREAALRLKAKGDNPGQRILTVTKNSARTITEVCADSLMSLPDFLRLNPDLVRSPLIPPGTPIRVFPPQR